MAERTGRSRGLWARAWPVVLTHWIPCSILGLITIETYLEAVDKGPTDYENLGAPGRIALILANGLVVAILAWLFHGIRIRRSRKRGGDTAALATRRRHRLRGTLLAFLAGAAALPIHLEPRNYLLYAQTLFVIALVVIHLRVFLRHTLGLIRPGRHPRARDIVDLLYLYISVIGAFTLLNLSLWYVHTEFTPGRPAFAGDVDRLLDMLYFTAVLMTTVGFGDIHPVSMDARFVVTLQCIVSYVMLALLMGLVLRGISSDDEEDGTDEEGVPARPAPPSPDPDSA
jgi:voltage-gated potassium channel